MKIDKVIFSFDENPLYADFWSIQANLVKKILDATPVLFLITDEESDFFSDEYGIVKKIDRNKCSNTPTSLQSQIIRMYGTKYFPDEVCLTADIDMLMIDRDYFINQIQNFGDDDLVIYDSLAYDENREEDCKNIDWHCSDRYPICYIAGKGKTFNMVLNTDVSFETYVERLEKFNLGWSTDEIYFGRCINNSTFDFPIHKLIRGYEPHWRAHKRINRHNFPVKLKYQNEIDSQKRDGLYNLNLLREGYYIDAHCPRPYSEYKNEIDYFVEEVLRYSETMNFLGKKYKTDKILHHRFDRIYPKFLEGFRDQEIKLFEIGCGGDYASFQMWHEYFLKGQIFCMDINEQLVTERGVVYQGDQTKIEDLQRMVDIIGPCDIIIDDGSHIPQHQLDSFNFLFENMLKNGGTYIIEDIECNYWNPKKSVYGYEIGSLNIVDHFQSLSHKINSEFNNFRNHQLISSITYFKNCIIITKMSLEEIEENKREYRFKDML